MVFRARTVDEMASRLREVEAEVSDLRCGQAVLVNELDKIHVADSTGHRSLNEWLIAELDVSRSSAAELVFVGRHLWKHRPEPTRLASCQLPAASCELESEAEY